MSRRLLLPVFLLLVLLSSATAQTPFDSFVSVRDYPYGPGDRQLDMKIKLLPGETTANIEIWVVYSDDKSEIENANLGGSVPQGRAKLGAVNSDAVVSATFIFPHHSNRRPNPADRNEEIIKSGHDVAYKVFKKKGRESWDSDLVEFVMPDKLTIVNIGDSFASGEGAPYSSGAKWDDDLCHRSGNAGQALAVQTLKKENPGLAIAFLNVSCSGAQIAEGLLQVQRKSKWLLESEVHQTPVEPQLDQVRAWLDENNYEELNILMISAGGNDVGFATYVGNYYVLPGNLATDTEARRNLERSVDGTIPNSYIALKGVIDEMFTYDKVFVSEYPDPTRNTSGQFCDLGPLSPPAEFEAMYNSFLVRLNTKIRQTIAPFKKWIYVDGIMNASKNNGLCAGNKQWFNDIFSTWSVQGDAYGMVHPNKNGHANTYKPAYERQLRGAIRDIRIAAAKERAKEAMAARTAEEQRKRRLSLRPRDLPKPRLVDAVAKQSQLLSTSKQALTSTTSVDATTLMKLESEAKAASKRLPSFGPDNRMPNDSEK